MCSTPPRPGIDNHTMKLVIADDSTHANGTATDISKTTERILVALHGYTVPHNSHVTFSRSNENGA